MTSPNHTPTFYPHFEITYQLMNDDFPAEWFPMSMMVIFFLGASSFSPRVSAIEISPCSGSAYNVWHS